MREHGEAIEADLLRFYSVDIRDLGTETLTWRRLGVLIRQLPSHSATLLSKDGADSFWGLPEQLLAAIADLLSVANWQRAAAGSKPGQQPPKPEPIKRPGVKDDGKKIGGKTSISISEMRRRMERLNGRRSRR